MARSGKYGKITIPKIGEDEPTFILRAQDILAASTIEMYRHGSPLAKDVIQEIQVFQHWNGSKKMLD